MAEPTLEELQKEVDELKKLVVPHFDPPSGNEMSFPVERQGITQTQFQQMNLPTGDGVIITDDGENSHLLTGHSSDSETNARNTLILRVAANTGRAEAVIAGFYHVLTEDVELEFPPVSSTTTYYVCITYDPRRFRDPSGPVFLKVYDDTPPDTDGRKHLILHTVTRRPNELLTRAERRLYRQVVSPLITVSRGVEGLPESTQVPYSTLAIDRSTTSGGNVVPGTGQIFEGRGIHGWHNVLVGEWVDVFQGNRNGNRPATGRDAPKARFFLGGVQLKGFFNLGDSGSSTFAKITDDRYIPSRTIRTPMASSGATVATLTLSAATGDLNFGGGFGGTYVSVDGIFYPLD